MADGKAATIVVPIPIDLPLVHGQGKLGAKEEGIPYTFPF
jgi:hypothetical protein